jgi:hypothetical protein
MKNIFLFAAILCLHFEASASEKMWIYFTDKDNSGQNITLDDKAIQRRLKVGIEESWYDRPVAQSYISTMEELGSHS